MHDDRTQIERRLFRVLNERLIPAIHSKRVPMAVRRWDVSGEPVAVAEALAADYAAAAIGDRWGPAWGTTWFELTAEVPSSWSGERLEGVVDLGFQTFTTLGMEGGPGFAAEGLVYRPDGTAIKGLHPYNRWFPVEPDATQVRVFVEAAANPTITMKLPNWEGDVETASEDPLYVLREADLAIVDVDVRDLAGDLEVLGQLAASCQPATLEERRFEPESLMPWTR